MKGYVLFDAKTTWKEFLLTSETEEYAITRRDLAEVARAKGSVVYSDGKIMIDKDVIPKIIGTKLNPMDTEGLESEF
jgi:hypothetical protein